MEKELENLFTEFLQIVGEDVKRQGLKNTPKRVAKSWLYLLKGYKEDPEKLIKSAIFRESSEDMICVKNIEFYSICEHHLLPFFGKCHIGYIPKGYIIGLSKLCRLVEIYSRRLQVQERMTKEIAEMLQKYLNPRGVAVVMEAQHLCMQMRGVEKQHSEAVTSAMLGSFRENQATRMEFFKLISAERK